MTGNVIRMQRGRGILPDERLRVFDKRDVAVRDGRGLPSDNRFGRHDDFVGTALVPRMPEEKIQLENALPAEFEEIRQDA